MGSIVAKAGKLGNNFQSGGGGAGKLIVRSSGMSIQSMADTFCNLFAIWLTITAIVAVQNPATFTWIPDKAFTGLLGLLMFSVGVTTTIDDFKECLKKPEAVAVNFFACYGIMPALAYVTALAMKAEGAIMAGLVLVGSINGGQASNLCTLIAGGDVALSVLMTTSTTLGCIVMTPLICKFLLGSVVPVNAMGIVYSTFQVVLAPIFLGVGVNTMAPAFAKAVEPYTPIVGIVSTIALVGAAVAKVAPFILSAGWPLQLACLNLHLVGGLLGYGAMALLGFDTRTCRTVAIETAMKSSAFGFLLASQHFGVFAVRVPSAVSVIWMAITGSALAVYWKFEDQGKLKAA
jgi:BASS family bile acid:Na+ symporter